MKIKYQILYTQGLLVILSVLIVVLNVVTFYSMENDANFINYSGRLRALSYKMAYLSSIIIEKKEEAFDERKELRESIEAYDNIIEGLIQGSTDLAIKKIKYKPTLEKLQSIKDLWLEKYKDAYLAVNSNGDIEAKNLIDQGVLDYVESIDDMVTSYSKYSRDKVVKAISMNGILIIVIIFISSYTFISANNKIKKPMYALLKELKDMDLIDEDLAKKISLYEKDEITVMSSYIDELAYDGLTKVYNRRTGIPNIISVSHGIVGCNTEDKCNVDTLIKLADEKMYEEKRKIKEIGFNVVRRDFYGNKTTRQK